ncbi:MAG: hypothetical protein AAGC43_10735 [Bacteroidota bacterium]
MLTLIALLLEMLIINEIVRREKVTDFSSFAMLFFVLLLIVFPESMLDRNIVFCNFFLLLALWRLLSVKAIKNVKHKIFDASFSIGVASLFVDWALIYLILVFLVINLYERGTVKNWFIPFIAIATMSILAFTSFQFYDGISFLENHYRFQINFLVQDFTTFEIIKSSLFVFSTFLIITLAFLKLRQKGGGKLLSLRILFFAFVLSVVVMSFNLNKMSTALLGFFPFSVFITNYLETFKQNRYKEVAIVMLIFLPFFILGVQLSS